MKTRPLEILAFALILFFIACQPEDEIVTRDPNAQLAFSSDTVKFDTLLSSRGSITQRFKIYNPSENAVIIDEIAIATGGASPYTIYINGQPGKNFKEQFLLGGDSLLALVEVLIDPQDEDLPFLVKDSVVFRTNGNMQHVKLIAWGQDAHYLDKQILPCDAVWTGERPVVLLDTVVVDSACTLTIEAGARIFADQAGALIVGGTLRVNGAPEERVAFTNSRLDIKDAFGQWRGISFVSSSVNNKIEYASIRNAYYGLFFIKEVNPDSAIDLELNQVIIENMVTAGLVCYNIDLLGRNLLVNNCADFTGVFFAGGTYLFDHCTFANYSLDFTRENPALYFSNIYEQENLAWSNDLVVELHNSIVWGDLKNELGLGLDPSAGAGILINHSLLKTEDKDLDINNNMLNVDPGFVNYREYDYRLDSLSPAKNAGSPEYRLPVDLAGNARDSVPDMGAYEWIEKE